MPRSVERVNMNPRLDELLVERGFFDDLHAAAAAILAGEVVVGEHRQTNAGLRVKPDVDVRLKGQNAFVSRGGKKLEGALKAFDFSPKGLHCADLGASSGGFTDCLLKAGAAHVSSIDVNYGQFAWSLRTDERVSLYERTNVRGINVEAVGGPFDLVVGDLSFVSIRTLMPDFVRLMREGGHLIMLVKPQFEVAREQVEQGGIVRSEQTHKEVLRDVCACCGTEGLDVLGLAFSPIKGPKGNIEFLLMASKCATNSCGRATISEDTICKVVESAHSSLGGAQ